jgi:hypothetical protein
MDQGKIGKGDNHWWLTYNGDGVHAWRGRGALGDKSFDHRYRPEDDDGTFFEIFGDWPNYLSGYAVMQHIGRGLELDFLDEIPLHFISRDAVIDPDTEDHENQFPLPTKTQLGQTRIANGIGKWEERP